MAWKAGAEFHKEEQFGDKMYTGPFGWPWYGIGTPDNTWHPCNIVDNKGKEIPWMNTYGARITAIEDRTAKPKTPKPDGPIPWMHVPTPDIDPAKIESGEYELPLWADLTSLPDYERRGIWGLMIGNEGKTRTSIYTYFNKAGFNPEKDMLQVPVMNPEVYGNPRKDYYQGEPNNNKFWKSDTLRGVVVDWNQMTNVDGLFAAGSEAGQGGAACGAGGAYAGNRAAEYAMKTRRGEISEAQVKQIKDHVYGPIDRMDDPKATVSWKELWMGVNRVMQQDCGDYRTKVLCEHGLNWLDSIKKLEMQMTYARNPHELTRVLECESKLTTAEVYLYLAIANFNAEEKGEGEGKVMLNKLVDGRLVTTYKENKWWLKPPYAPTYRENYEKCRELELKA